MLVVTFFAVSYKLSSNSFLYKSRILNRRPNLLVNPEVQCIALRTFSVSVQLVLCSTVSLACNSIRAFWLICVSEFHFCDCKTRICESLAWSHCVACTKNNVEATCAERQLGWQRLPCRRLSSLGAREARIHWYVCCFWRIFVEVKSYYFNLKKLSKLITSKACRFKVVHKTERKFVCEKHVCGWAKPWHDFRPWHDIWLCWYMFLRDHGRSLRAPRSHGCNDCHIWKKSQIFMSGFVEIDLFCVVHGQNNILVIHHLDTQFWRNTELYD